MASFQMLSPAAESFFTYFYNALCSLNPFFGCPYELEDKRCALLRYELVNVVLRLGRCHSISSFGFVLFNQDR